MSQGYFIGAEFTGAPPSDATLRTVHSLLGQHAAEKSKLSVTRAGISLWESPLDEISHSQKFRFVFDAKGGYGGAIVSMHFPDDCDEDSAEGLLPLWMLLALKAELGPRMTLLCRDGHDEVTADDWLMWAEDPLCGIDIGQKLLRAMHKRGQLYDRASKPQRADVCW